MSKPIREVRGVAITFHRAQHLVLRHDYELTFVEPQLAMSTIVGGSVECFYHADALSRCVFCLVVIPCDEQVTHTVMNTIKTLMERVVTRDFTSYPHA